MIRTVLDVSVCKWYSVYISLLIQIRQLFPRRKQCDRLKTHILVISKKVTDGCFTNISILLHKMLINGLELFGLLVDYCGVFISCLNFNSDGTHSLQKIHWLAFSSDEIICISDGLRGSKFSENVICFGELFL